MQVILLEKIGKLGSLGDVVEVKNGFARNYLLPQGMALMATNSNLEEFEKRRADAEREDKQKMEDAKKLAEKIDKSDLIFIGQSGDDGRLYGSIGPKDIASKVKDTQGEEIHPSCIKLGAKIKDLGIYEVLVQLHPEVSVTVRINIARSEEEAKAAFEKNAQQALIEAQESKQAASVAKKKESVKADKPVEADGNVELSEGATSAEDVAEEEAS